MMEKISVELMEDRGPSERKVAEIDHGIPHKSNLHPLPFLSRTKAIYFKLTS